MDYFKYVMEILEKNKDIVQVNKCEYKLVDNEYSCELFGNDISENSKMIYNTYSLFKLNWQSKVNKDRGFIEFVPYSRVITEHEKLCSEIEDIEDDIIEEQDKVIDDIHHWYPLFLFPSGDKFCFDNRTGQILFFEHDVFDSGINLHGLVIADSIDVLLANWSNILFIDIYDWLEGVNDKGLDISKKIFDFVRDLQNK